MEKYNCVSSAWEWQLMDCFVVIFPKVSIYRRESYRTGPDRTPSAPRAEGLCSQLCEVLQHLQPEPPPSESASDLENILPLSSAQKGRPAALDDYRLNALTSHIMKVMERLVLAHLRTPVCPSQDTSVCISAHVGVNDAILYLLQEACSALIHHSPHHVLWLLQRLQHHPVQTAEGQTGENAGGFSTCHTGRWLSDGQVAVHEITELCVGLSDRKHLRLSGNCAVSSSPPTLQTLSTALSRVICRNSLMTLWGV